MRAHPVDKLEQHFYKSAAGLLQLVRFYVCTCDEGTLRGGHKRRLASKQPPTPTHTLPCKSIPDEQ
jgi:glutamyl/glutaminyl-tRNA synthetase